MVHNIIITIIINNIVTYNFNKIITGIFILYVFFMNEDHKIFLTGQYGNYFNPH